MSARKHRTRPICATRLRTTIPAFLAVTLGCATVTLDHSEDAAAAVRAQGNLDFPYHPLVYHLDLSNLAYQLHAQSLAWPFDPYYEEFEGPNGKRTKFMKTVQSWALNTGRAQSDSPAGLRDYRGPGTLGGFEDNPRHDPIIYQYSRVYPWSPAIAKGLSRWNEFVVPDEITRGLAEAHICYRQTDGPLGAIRMEQIPKRGHTSNEAKDILLIFEGGTGDKGEEDQSASQSLIGFALLRSRPAGQYDVHISFRGSRSGSGSRSIRQALPTRNATGNPDWITDLGFRAIVAPPISKVGEVHRGMARATVALIPRLLYCLKEAAHRKSEQPPQNIYITGHSLGGALAQHFASAVLLGSWLGPDGQGTKMPNTLRGWPWSTLKLITYGAPRVGSTIWAKALAGDRLQSRSFSTVAGSPWDANAIAVTDPEILPRVLASDRPAAYRVLLPTDPITTGKLTGGRAVGTAIYLKAPSVLDLAQPPDFSAHDPVQIRRRMVKALRQPNIPPPTWRYQAMEAVNPERNAEDRGEIAEFRKLADVIRNYHQAGTHWFDAPAFEEAFKVFEDLRP